MGKTSLICLLSMLVMLLAGASDIYGQSQVYGISNSLVNNAARQAQASINRYSARNTVLGRSTVSPYLRLSNTSVASAAQQYQAIRGMRDRNRQMDQQGQQLQLLSTQINSLSRGGNGIRSGITGHPTRFMTYSHYYRLGR